MDIHVSCGAGLRAPAHPEVAGTSSQSDAGARPETCFIHGALFQLHLLVTWGPGSVGFGSWKGVSSRILPQGVHGCCSQRPFHSRVCVLGSWRSCCLSRCWALAPGGARVPRRSVADRPPLPQPSEAEGGVPGAGLGSVLCGSISGAGVVYPCPATLRV